MKPRLAFGKGRWYCVGGGFVGIGASITLALADWKQGVREYFGALG